MKQENADSLAAKGYTTQEISNISDNTVEQELYARAQMSDADLVDLGYTSDQIAILREYDGSPLENNPQMRAVTATFSGAIYRDYSTASSASMIFNFSWNQAPLASFPYITDAVTCAWIGYNSDGIQIGLSKSGAACSVTYSDGLVESFPVSVEDPQRWVKADIYQNTGAGNWVRNGSLVVQVAKTVSSSQLNTSVFTFAFGHSTIFFNAGVSIDASGPSLGFDFGRNVDRVYQNSYTLRH